ncbi:hypothetical protein EVA_21117 [gut metagenome]|uniref:Uncharacterized protein n=1 Tax=gut metagenome TaxID=749906 RepID=J9BT88_9ZZZZ
MPAPPSPTVRTPTTATCGLRPLCLRWRSWKRPLRCCAPA